MADAVITNYTCTLKDDSVDKIFNSYFRNKAKYEGINLVRYNTIYLTEYPLSINELIEGIEEDILWSNEYKEGHTCMFIVYPHELKDLDSSLYVNKSKWSPELGERVVIHAIAWVNSSSSLGDSNEPMGDLSDLLNISL